MTTGTQFPWDMANNSARGKKKATRKGSATKSNGLLASLNNAAGKRRGKRTMPRSAATHKY